MIDSSRCLVYAVVWLLLCCARPALPQHNNACGDWTDVLHWDVFGNHCRIDMNTSSTCNAVNNWAIYISVWIKTFWCLVMEWTEMCLCVLLSGVKTITIANVIHTWDVDHNEPITCIRYEHHSSGMSSRYRQHISTSEINISRYTGIRVCWVGETIRPAIPLLEAMQSCCMQTARLCNVNFLVTYSDWHAKLGFDVGLYIYLYLIWQFVILLTFKQLTCTVKNMPILGV
jgi:hypothetical protein